MDSLTLVGAGTQFECAYQATQPSAAKKASVVNRSKSVPNDDFDLLTCSSKGCEGGQY